MKIQSHKVLITGGASGIGRIMCRMALQRGASALAIWDINEKAVAETIAELKEKFPGAQVEGYRCDISSPDSVQAAFESTVSRSGDIDILINCAGIITNNKFFSEQTDQDIIRTFSINTEGAMFVTLRFLPGMKERGAGHIVNITSSAGMLALPRMSLYASSKWAAIGWSESMRLELKREKSPVKVTTVAPYFINTGMFEGIKSVFRILPPEEVAAKTLTALEHDRPYKGINFPSHFIRLMQGIFPFRLFDFMFGEVFGLYTVMDHFMGRRPEGK